MDINELIDVLEELAQKDLAGGEDIFNHPCSAAVRMIKNMENDVLFLRSSLISRCDITPSNASKKLNMITKTAYNPKA